MPTSRDMAIFVLTTTITLLLAHACGVKIQWSLTLPLAHAHGVKIQWNLITILHGDPIIILLDIIIICNNIMI